MTHSLSRVQSFAGSLGSVVHHGCIDSLYDADENSDDKGIAKSNDGHENAEAEGYECTRDVQVLLPPPPPLPVYELHHHATNEATFIVRYAARFPLLTTALVFLVPLLSGIALCYRIDSLALIVDISSYEVDGDESIERLNILDSLLPFSFKTVATQLVQTQEFELLQDANEHSSHDAMTEFEGDRRRTGLSLQLVFVANNKDDNILNKSDLHRVRDVENYLINSALWSRYCRIDSTGLCSQPTSITKVLFPEHKGNEIVLNGRGNDMLDVADALDIVMRTGAYGFFDKNFGPHNLRSKTLSSSVRLGKPLLAEMTKQGQTDGEILNEFLNEIRPFLEQLSTQRIRVLYTGGNLIWEEIFDGIERDIVLGGVSLVLVLVYLWVCTGSLFIASFGCLAIALSFVPALAVFVYYFSNTFSIFHVASVWIILGIGTDDIFIFFDSWRQSDLRLRCHTSLSSRLQWTLKNAGGAMLVTSLTTAVAFFSALASRIRPVREFGSFMGLLVVANFYMAMTFFPCCVIIYEKYIRRLTSCPTPITLCNQCLHESNAMRHQPVPSAPSSLSSSYMECHRDISAKIPLKMRLMRTYATWITQHRFVVLLVFTAGTAYMVSKLSSLKAPIEIPMILPADSNLEMLRRLYADTLQTCDGCRSFRIESDSNDISLEIPLHARNSTVNSDAVNPSSSSSSSSSAAHVQNLGNNTDASASNEQIRRQENLCPTNANGVVCSRHGNCMPSINRLSAYCSCSPGFGGIACELSCPGVAIQNTSLLVKVCNDDGNCVFPSPWSAQTMLLTCQNSLDACMNGDETQCSNYILSQCPTTQMCRRVWRQCHSGSSSRVCALLTTINCVYDVNDVVPECSCTSGIHGETCEHHCPGLSVTPDGTTSVCSSHGVCIELYDENKANSISGAACNCTDNYGGFACELAPASTPPSATLSAANSLHVNLVFGVHGFNMESNDNEDEAEMSEIGTPIFDPTFDIVTHADSYFRVCAHLRALDNTHIRADIFRCFFDELREYAMNQDANEQWSTTRETFTHMAIKFLRTPQGEHFASKVGFNARTEHVLFWRIEVQTLTSIHASANVLKTEYEFWQHFVEKLQSDDKVSSTLFQAAREWPRMHLELALIEGSIMACSITIVVTAFSLLLFSRSVITTCLGTISVAACLSVVGGIMSLLHWTFGVVEALSLSMLVGLAVDYQLHIGHFFASSSFSTPSQRVQDVLVTIGGSVWSSALTTACSTAVLLFCRVQILVKFGAMVTLTAVTSLLFALGFFTSSLAIFGSIGSGERKEHADTTESINDSSKMMMSYVGAQDYDDDDDDDEVFDVDITRNRDRNHRIIV